MIKSVFYCLNSIKSIQKQKICLSHQKVLIKYILAFSDDGCVILKTIVETTLMKMTKPVPDDIANVQNRNSDVAMTNVFRADGNVITTMVRFLKYFLTLFLQKVIYLNLFDTFWFFDFRILYFLVQLKNIVKLSWITAPQDSFTSFLKIWKKFWQLSVSQD